MGLSISTEPNIHDLNKNLNEVQLTGLNDLDGEHLTKMVVSEAEPSIHDLQLNVEAEPSTPKEPSILDEPSIHHLQLDLDEPSPLKAVSILPEPSAHDLQLSLEAEPSPSETTSIDSEPSIENLFSEVENKPDVTNLFSSEDEPSIKNLFTEDEDEEEPTTEDDEKLDTEQLSIEAEPSIKNIFTEDDEKPDTEKLSIESEPIVKNLFTEIVDGVTETEDEANDNPNVNQTFHGDSENQDENGIMHLFDEIEPKLNTFMEEVKPSAEKLFTVVLINRYRYMHSLYSYHTNLSNPIVHIFVYELFYYSCTIRVRLPIILCFPIYIHMAPPSSANWAGWFNDRKVASSQCHQLPINLKFIPKKKI